MRQVVNDQLAAQLTVQGPKTGCHERRQVALHDPLLQGRRARRSLDNVQQPRSSKVSHFALVVDIIHEDVEQREIHSLHSTSKSLPLIKILEAVLARRRLGRLEPSGKYRGVETDLGRDVEGQLNHARFGIQAESNTIDSGNAYEQIGQAAGKRRVLNKGLFLAFDERREEEDSFLDDPFVVGGGGDFANGDVDLFDGGILNTGMGEGTSALVAENIGEFLEADFERLGGFAITG